MIKPENVVIDYYDMGGLLKILGLPSMASREEAAGKIEPLMEAFRLGYAAGHNRKSVSTIK